VLRSRRALKAALGPGRSLQAGLAYDRALGAVQRTVGPYRREAERLRSLRGAYAGERCFIIGNGPSLNRMDLDPLRSEYTFGLNRIYLLFDRVGFSTSFLVCVNRLVWEQFADELVAQDCIKFAPWNQRGRLQRSTDTYFFRTTPRRIFRVDARRTGLYEGSTVTFVAMQLAYYLGFRTAVLIGVDHSFAIKGGPHTTVVADASDANHFDSQYFAKGVRWNLPDLDESERAYLAARNAWERDGRQILDATVDGKLTVFPKIRYENAIMGPSSRGNLDHR
jgi:hypothetical protein